MRPSNSRLYWCGLALLPLLGGCAGKLEGVLLPNLLPTVELSAAPMDPSGLYFYRYRLQWTSFDPDGSVDHFLYAIDPPTDPTADTTWVATRGNHVDLEFRSETPVPGDPYGVATSPHTFVLAAVDDDGDIGPRVNRSFFSFTQAPTVRITRPTLTLPNLPTSFDGLRIAFLTDLHHGPYTGLAFITSAAGPYC